MGPWHLDSEECFWDSLAPVSCCIGFGRKLWCILTLTYRIPGLFHSETETCLNQTTFKASLLFIRGELALNLFQPWERFYPSHIFSCRKKCSLLKDSVTKSSLWCFWLWHQIHIHLSWKYRGININGEWTLFERLHVGSHAGSLCKNRQSKSVFVFE